MHFHEHTRPHGSPLVEIPDVSSVPRVGDRLGSYALIELLGDGATALVYRAEHVQLGRWVAIKLLRPEVARDLEMRRRFASEARAANAIRSDNVVQITDIVIGDGIVPTYAVMELVDGEPLGALIPDEGLPLASALRIAAQIGNGLCAVHRAGVVHRDLKPDNVLLGGPEGEEIVKLIDFGLARCIEPARSPTAPGQVFGTLGYMAPEQCCAGKLTCRTDIYAFGVTLYEMLTGRLPLWSSDIETMVKLQLETEPQPPSVHNPDVPPELDELVVECIAAAPMRRPPSAEHVFWRIAAIEQRLRDEARGKTAGVTPSGAAATRALSEAEESGTEDSDNTIPLRSRGPVATVPKHATAAGREGTKAAAVAADPVADDGAVVSRDRRAARIRELSGRCGDPPRPPRAPWKTALVLGIGIACAGLFTPRSRSWLLEQVRWLARTFRDTPALVERLLPSKSGSDTPVEHPRRPADRAH